MSGVGKSAVAGSLKARGYVAVETDHDAYVVAPDGEWLWDEETVDRHLSDPGAETVFIVGSASNQVGFYDRFDVIVLLSAPTEVMLDRIRTRANNPFGKSPEERAKVLDDQQQVEPILRRVAHHEIVTDRPVDDVVDELVRLALHVEI